MKRRCGGLNMPSSLESSSEEEDTASSAHGRHR
jgi:hypothetical protein